MKFSMALLVPIVTLATSASAAECYNQGGSHRCVNRNSIWVFRGWYCTQAWQGNIGRNVYNANNGFSAVFTRDGPFNSQQQCWDTTMDIIKSCFGRKDGGSWTGSSMLLSINFCS